MLSWFLIKGHPGQSGGSAVIGGLADDVEILVLANETPETPCSYPAWWHTFKQQDGIHVSNDQHLRLSSVERFYLWLEVHVVVEVLGGLVLVVAVERSQKIGRRGAWSPLVLEAPGAGRMALLGSPRGLLWGLRLCWRWVVVVRHWSWWRDWRRVGGVRKVLGMLTVRSIAFCTTAAKLHPSESQSSDSSKGGRLRADAALRSIGAGRRS